MSNLNSLQNQQLTKKLSDRKLLIYKENIFWWRGWDLNPRRTINPRWFSRPVHSTALSPLQKWCPSSDSNTQPPDYKSGALPVVLDGHINFMLQ
jgi:hypothetical protein